MADGDFHLPIPPRTGIELEGLQGGTRGWGGAGLDFWTHVRAFCGWNLSFFLRVGLWDKPAGAQVSLFEPCWRKWPQLFPETPVYSGVRAMDGSGVGCAV